MAPLAGDSYCWIHSPRVAKARKAAMREGGRRRMQLLADAERDLPAPELRTTGDLLELCERAAADALATAPGLRRAGMLVRVATAARGVVEGAAFEERIAALEAALERLGRSRVA